MLRLAESPTPPHAAVQHHLRADLAEGHRTGRFTHGDDPVTVDLVTGTLMATLRRLVSPDHPPDDDRAVPDVVARLLEAIGIEPHEARTLAVAAHDAEREHAAPAETAS